MKSLFKKKAKTVIGLDIGTKFVKAISLNVSGKQCKVQAFACEPISGNAFADREIKDFDAISKALKKVQLSMKSQGKESAIAVAGSSVISKTVYMEPDQSDFELETQIELEADSLIPYPLDEVYLDFQEIGSSKTHVGKKEHNFGVNSFTQDLAMLYNIDIEDVESQITNNTAPDSWFSESFPAYISSLQQQLQRALQMFVATKHKPMPTSIHLCGGGALLPNIAEQLNKEMGLDVNVFNPLSKMSVDGNLNKDKLHGLAPQFTLAVGLATRSLSEWQK